jgi:hypothetical protein
MTRSSVYFWTIITLDMAWFMADTVFFHLKSDSWRHNNFPVIVFLILLGIPALGIILIPKFSNWMGSELKNENT